MSGKGRTMLILVSERRPQLFKDALIAALGIVIAVGAPGRAQIPSGLTEVWPTDTLATIQAAVDSGGVVYFQPDTSSWTGTLVITNTVELTAPKPTGGFDTSTGKDDRLWRAKITKSPTGIWDTMDSIIKINYPGKTENVIISNLDTECLSLGMCILLQGGGNSVKIANCRIKTVDDGFGFVSWQAGDVSVIIEDCCFEAGTTGFLYPDGTAPDTDCIVFGMSRHASIEVKNKIAVNRCDISNTSTAVEVAWNQDPNTQVTISNNWLRSSGIGVALFYYDNVCSVGTVRHNTMVGNMHFAHYENSGRGGTIESNRFECSGGGIASLYFKDSGDVTIQRNSLTGNVLSAGIMLDGQSSGYVFVGNDLSDLRAGTAQILVQPGSHDNLFTRNIIGSLGPEASASVQCFGDSNSFIRNDYTQSGISGPTAGAVPCLWLANSNDPGSGDLIAEPERNLVFESDGFPPGTDAAEQVLDDPREFTGTTTNIVVGH
jgi:hypothetical protein